MTLLICSYVIVLHAGVVVQVTGCVHLLTHLGKAVIANVENITLGCWLVWCWKYYFKVNLQNPPTHCKNPPIHCKNQPTHGKNQPTNCKNPPIHLKNQPFHCNNQPTHCRPKTFSTLSSSVVHLYQTALLQHFQNMKVSWLVVQMFTLSACVRVSELQFQSL